jgi:hypothetical protein
MQIITSTRKVLCVGFGNGCHLDCNFFGARNQSLPKAQFPHLERTQLLDSEQPEVQGQIQGKEIKKHLD